MVSVSALSLLAACVLVGCQGNGSDVGPRLPRLPSESSKVNVYDDVNRGVVGARVSIKNTATAALTGRNGRGDFLASPSGRQVMRIDGTSAAATNTDLLGAIDVAVSLLGGDVPTVFHLPDASQGGAASVAAGNQAATIDVANPAANGGSVVIDAGTSVGIGSGAASVTLRSGSLQAHHLPGDLPAGVLMGRGLFIDPPTITFTPGARVSVTNDLAATGSVTLYHLLQTTGEWVTAGSGTAGGGLLQASGAITTGGLYAFGVSVTTGSVRGRVLDAQSDAVPEALINVDGRRTTSNSGGFFVVAGVPAQNGDGSSRTATVEVYAGGGWMPSISALAVTMNGASEIDAGSIGLDTLPAGNIRMLQIRRGRSEVKRQAGVSSLFGSVGLVTTSDANGQAIFEDVPLLWFGFQGGFPSVLGFPYYSQSVGFAGFGRRWTDVSQFFDESYWYGRSRSSRILATDSVGGGPLFGVPIVLGRVNDVGLLGNTLEGGVIFGDRGLGGRVTASIYTERAGLSIRHAFSIVEPNGEHLELPLQQVLRIPLGMFDRHGLVTGTVTGANPASEHRLRATRRLELQEWWDDVVEGIPIRSSLPIDVDPQTTHGAYQVGVDRAGGNLAVSEVVTSGGITTLQKVAIATDVEPIEGGAIARDLPLEHVASTAFTAPGVLAALDASIATNTLTFALALGESEVLAVDVVRSIGGNHSVSGSDLTLMLPALSGTLAGNSWYALLRGTGSPAAGTITQSSLLRFNAAGVVKAPVLLPVPTISSPATAATVATTGFSVQFSLPAGTMYATLELRSDSGGELRLWQVFVPPWETEFSFTNLPVGVPTPLASAKTYSLTLSAYASTGGPLVNSPTIYRDLTTYIQSIGSVERGADSVSSITIQVTTL